jgi:DNA-binding response OmpR family regulator
MSILTKQTILLLEDNIEFANNFCKTLEIEFQTVFHAKNLHEASFLYETKSIDIIISDIKVQEENGLEFIRKVREHDKTTPIIILSAHKDEAFLFQAIGLNILSYELKPLSYQSFKQLLLLMQDTLGKNQHFLLQEETFYNSLTKEILYKKQSIALTKKEILFIELLLKDTQKIFTQTEIQEYVWENQDMSESALKNFLMRFRKKVPTKFILTINGLGYKLNNK